jgi:hypothetical protein
MSATTAEPVKNRFRTLDQARDHIEELEAAGDPTQLKATITSLTSQLAARDAEIRALKAAGSSQQKASSTNPPPASSPAAERPLAELSKRELADLMDEANARGDKAATDKLWREYRSRK